MIRVFTLLLAVFLFVQTIDAQMVKIFVASNGSNENSGFKENAPVYSLNKAFEIVKDLKRKQQTLTGIDIEIKEGNYLITNQLTITHEMGGTKECPVNISGLNNGKVVFNGAKVVSGWKKYKSNIWKTTIPEVKSGNWKFRQLFVNGQARALARFPNEGFYHVAGLPDGGPDAEYHTPTSRFQFAPGNINPQWINISDVRVIVYYYWSDAHLQIANVDTKTNIVTFKYPAEKRFTDDFTRDGAKYIVENVFEGLDKPGEWYLNSITGELFYIPLEGENMSELTFEAPVTNGYFNIVGNPLTGQYVENLHFKNISFKYSNFMLPEGDQNDMQASMSVPGAVTFEGVRNCSFENCAFQKIGTYALNIKQGCSDIVIGYNSITDISAGGIKLNGGAEDVHPVLRTKNISIFDNEIGNYGLEYPSAVGVLLMNAENCYIGHNHIHHGGYTGVSLGWVWGYERSISRDNIVEFNHIHHIGQGLLSDMGGIYTLGVSPGTVLRNNLIHDVDANKYGGWGIYHDEGSTHILDENNIVYNTKYAAFNIHYAKEITVRNNIFAFGKLEMLSRGRPEPHSSVYFEGNIVYWNSVKDVFSSDWKDFSYKFHVNPNIPEQPTKTSTFDIDYNIFYNPNLPVDSIKCNGNTWIDWQKRGKDIHSLYINPQFVDPDKFDFTLKPGSPAYKMGFKDIDMSTVGVRKQ